MEFVLNSKLKTASINLDMWSERK